MPRRVAAGGVLSRLAVRLSSVRRRALRFAPRPGVGSEVARRAKASHCGVPQSGGRGSRALRPDRPLPLGRTGWEPWTSRTEPSGTGTTKPAENAELAGVGLESRYNMISRRLHFKSLLRGYQRVTRRQRPHPGRSTHGIPRRCTSEAASLIVPSEACWRRGAWRSGIALGNADIPSSPRRSESNHEQCTRLCVRREDPTDVHSGGRAAVRETRGAEVGRRRKEGRRHPSHALSEGDI